MTQDSRTLVRLFERCGERDLRFVVRSGLVLGGMLGVLQMLLWRVWSPWWSLALTGGLVGYVTDLLAIRMLFEPVDPVRMTLTLTVTLTLTLTSGWRGEERRVVAACRHKHGELVGLG